MFRGRAPRLFARARQGRLGECSAVAAFPLDGTERLHLATPLSGYVQGSALKLVSEIDAQTDTGVSREEWLQSATAALEAELRSGRFPELARTVAEGDPRLDLDSLFDFGLRGLLDGFAVFVRKD